MQQAIMKDKTNARMSLDEFQEKAKAGTLHLAGVDKGVPMEPVTEAPTHKAEQVEMDTGIEKNVPIPVSRRLNRNAYIAEQMEIGDSKRFDARSEAQNLGHQLRKQGFHYAIRNEGDGFRVWKCEPLTKMELMEMEKKQQKTKTKGPGSIRHY